MFRYYYYVEIFLLLCGGKSFFTKIIPLFFYAAMKNAYSSQMIRKAMPSVLDASLGRVMVTLSSLTV